MRSTEKYRAAGWEKYSPLTLAAARAGEDAVEVDLVTGYLSGSTEGNEEIREMVLLLFAE